MDPITIALLAASAIKGGIGLVKSIKGRKDKKSGEAKMNKAIDDIQYTRPDEYKEIMGMLNKRSSSVSTRRESAEERVREQTATSMTGIRQLSDSPVAAGSLYSGIKQKEQQVIADLGVEYEGIQDEAVMGQVKGLEMGAGFSEGAVLQRYVQEHD